MVTTVLGYPILDSNSLGSLDKLNQPGLLLGGGGQSSLLGLEPIGMLFMTEQLIACPMLVTGFFNRTHRLVYVNRHRPSGPLQGSFYGHFVRSFPAV